MSEQNVSSRPVVGGPDPEGGATDAASVATPTGPATTGEHKPHIIRCDHPDCRNTLEDVQAVARRDALEARIIAGTTTKADVGWLVESLETLAAEKQSLLEQYEALRSAAEDSLSILDSLKGGLEFSRGEVIGRLRAALYPASEPRCTCPAGSYDYPNAVHTDYCALNQDRDLASEPESS